MRLFLGFLATALGLAACAPDEGASEATGATGQAVVGGSSSPAAQDATVLISDRGRRICSGTLIAPNLVLTARHCVSDWDMESECGRITGNLAPSQLTIAVGVGAEPADYAARGVKLYLPDANELCSSDVALLALDTDVTSVTPRGVSFAAPTQSSEGTAVGYGGGERTQRSGVKVLAVGPSTYSYRTASGAMLPMDPLVNEIVTTESTCFGDSGGPLLDADGRIFAIASRGVDEVCQDRPTVWITLAGHEKWLRDAATAAGHPITDARTNGYGKTPAMAGESGDDDDDSAGAASGSKKPKAAGSSDPSLDSSGCAAARRPGSAGGAFVLVLVGAALAALRRRRARR